MLPFIQRELDLTYFQLGIMVFVTNLTASLFQPLIGLYTDKRPQPWLLPAGMLFAALGMVGIAFSPSYNFLLLAVTFVGIGSSIFHPESSRVAHLAGGPRKGLAQSIFQVGGNSGQAIGPLLVALIFHPLGRPGTVWFLLPTLLGGALLTFIARWYRKELAQPIQKKSFLQGANLYGALSLLVLIVSVRSWVYTGIQSFFPLYLIHTEGISIPTAQVFAFLFLLAGAIGTFFGGPLSDKFGQRNLILLSMLGALPFSVLLPYSAGVWTYLLIFINGLVILCSFSVVVVYAQTLVPGKIGLVSGLMIGFAIGMGGIGASVLGFIADTWGLRNVIVLTTWLPLIGVLAFFLPKEQKTIE